MNEAIDHYASSRTNLRFVYRRQGPCKKKINKRGVITIRPRQRPHLITLNNKDEPDI